MALQTPCTLDYGSNFRELHFRTVEDGLDGAAQIGPLLEQAADPVASVTGAGAYDQDSVYAAVAERRPHATVTVPPCATAVPSKSAETDPTQRDCQLQEIAELGRITKFETAVARRKRVIGDGLRSRIDERRTTEMAVAIHALNYMLALGYPIYVRID